MVSEAKFPAECTARPVPALWRVGIAGNGYLPALRLSSTAGGDGMTAPPADLTADERRARKARKRNRR